MNKKKILLISLMAMTSSVFAQFSGINTTTPGTSLDVNGAITNRETVVAVAGNVAIIPANVSQVQLTGTATATVAITAPAAPNAGQRLVIFNNTTGGFGATLNGVTILNEQALEYVYSNSGWKSTDGGYIGATSANIYTANGTLADNRTVTQGANTLTFTGNQVNAFSVDATTLSVDAANDRIGIGTTTPSTKLTINTPDNNFGLTHTNGTVNLRTFIGGGAAWLGTTTNHDLNLEANNLSRMIILANGNVGISTTAPTTKLEIHGSVNGAIKIVDGTQAEGKVLTSDVNGIGTWQNVVVTNVTGITPQTSTPYGSTANKYMNSYIDLPKGKWFVYIGLLVNGATAANTRYASRLSLSSSATSEQESGFTFINGNKYILTQTSNGTAGAVDYGMFSSGVVRVDVSASTVRLYVWDINSRLHGTTSSTSLNNNGENYLFAIMAN